VSVVGIIVTLACPAAAAPSGPTLEFVVSPGFSPNGDGRVDVATISVKTGGRADVTILVARHDGRTVRTLATSDPVNGDAAYTWRGRNDAGKRVADGRYRVIATAQDPDGEVRQHAPVVVDTTPPAFVWKGIAPEPLRTEGPVRFTFTTGDRFSDRVWVSFVVTDSEARLVERVRVGRRSTGTRTLSWDARAPGSHAIGPGLYRVAVGVKDELGNTRTGSLRSFRDHRPVKAAVIRRVDGAGRRVALTFDDCTYGDSWKRILGALHASEARATFFCAGSMVPAHAPLARRTVALGNAIGSHTWNHGSLIGASEATVRRQVRRDQAAWWTRARSTPAPFFRPPNGEIGSTTLAAVGGEGFRWVVLWDVDPRDWSGISAGEITRRVLSSVRPGSIVVMHVKHQTAAAVAGILRGLRVRNLQPVSLPVLLRAGGLTR
jgi:peptidoglycan/xylan/chitin deacetylase (PgdA/CDA1 family)